MSFDKMRRPLVGACYACSSSKQSTLLLRFPVRKTYARFLAFPLHKKSRSVFLLVPKRSRLRKTGTTTFLWCAASPLVFVLFSCKRLHDGSLSLCYLPTFFGLRLRRFWRVQLRVTAKVISFCGQFVCSSSLSLRNI